jgi:hypothetical protein
VRCTSGSYRHARVISDVNWSGTNVAGTRPKYSKART